MTRYRTTWTGTLQELSYHLGRHAHFTRELREAGYASKIIDQTIRRLKQGKLSEEDVEVLRLMKFDIEKAE